MKNLNQIILIAFISIFGLANSQVLLNPEDTNPPTGLSYTVVDENDVNLFWNQPSSGGSTYLHWDSGENSDSFGFFLSAEQFSCASKWNPEHLTDYDGWSLTSIRFYVTNSNPTIQLKIWTGPDGDEVYSQDVTSFNVDDWTEIYLDVPYEIDASTELWVGIYIDMPFSGPVMGLDEGPAIEGQGDMIHWNGSWWDGPSFGVPANWNIQFQIEAPSVPVSLHWDSGENEDSFGFFLSAEQFSCAGKWNPEHLTDYDGWTINSIRFFVTNSNPTIQLKLWTGPDGDEVYSQDVTTFNVDEWTEVDLDVPFEIDASTELWGGIYIDMPFSGPVMGLDGGPAIEGQGDWTHWNGSWWDGASFGVPANWNIQLQIGNSDSKNVEDLLGYNVYRNDVIINDDLVTSTAYVDENLGNGIYDYYVTAMYDEGESDPSDPVEVVIDQPVIVLGDSLALVDLYNSCNGIAWNMQTNWFETPVSEWWGVTTTGTRVTRIWLQNNNLEGDVPESIADLTALEELHFESNNIVSIPDNFGELTALKECWLGWTSITDLPESFGDLSALEEVHLGFLELGELPESFGNLSSLVWLALGDSDLNSLPDNFGNLTSVQSCFIWGNNLTELPASFGGMESLSYLSAHNNQLSSLSDNFGDLDNLSKLYLEENLLVTLPESFGDLESLDTLQLALNSLTSLPDNFGNLSDLNWFGMSINNLTELPASFPNLATIEEVYVDQNQLESLPENMGDLSTLFSLGLSYNNLTSLPESMSELGELQALFALHNELESIPQNIGDLSKLKFLGLDWNDIVSIPDNIGNLSALGYIGLSNNQIESLPESFGDLEADTVLLFSNNIPELPSTMFDNSFTFLYVEDNALQFGSIEPLMGQVNDFTYNPQDKIGVEETVEIINGDSLYYTLEVSGENNEYVWKKNGTVLSGQTTNTLVLEGVSYDDQGSYTLTVTNSSVPALILTSFDVEISILTNINDLSVTDLEIYPNPVSGDRVFIKINNEEQVSGIELVNLSGSTVIQQIGLSNKTSLDISSLESGLYIVHVYFRDGKQITEKLMVR